MNYLSRKEINKLNLDNSSAFKINELTPDEKYVIKKVKLARVKDALKEMQDNGEISKGKFDEVLIKHDTNVPAVVYIAWVKLNEKNEKKDNK
jgi:hypothetical protein